MMMQINEFERYRTEAKEKWGSTEAWKEQTEKTKDYSAETWDSLADGMDEIMDEFAFCMQNGAKADSEDAQNLVKKLQNHITENYYTCTPEILSYLGMMYVSDDRFTANIDKHGDGTAEFISKAITFYNRKL